MKRKPPDPLRLDPAHAGLLRDVLENPDRDDLRLLFADWLEDNGRAERAEWIRYSIRVPHAAFSALVRKTDVFPTLGLEPAGSVFVGPPGPSQEERTWMWGETDGVGCAVHDLARGIAYRVERGFIAAISCRLSDFLAHAGLLFSSHPVGRVILSDTEPAANTLPPGLWGWWTTSKSRARRTRNDLPAELWLGLDSSVETSASVSPGHIYGWKWYDSREDATAALELACVAHGRRLARYGWKWYESREDATAALELACVAHGRLVARATR